MFKVSMLAIVMFCGASEAQTVRAPRAQALIDALMARHPEMQTIGLHVTPPGLTESLNIACSKPGKVGKVSADLDTGVIATGKPSRRRTPKGAFDMGVPISDALGNPLGMVVIVIRETFTSDPDIALKQAFLIRDELQRQLPALPDIFTGGSIVRSPVSMVVQTPLPGIAGSFGHFAVDPQQGRLFLAAEGNRSIEVLTFAGEHTSTAKLAHAPGALAFDAQSNMLLVADPAGAACLVLDARTLNVVKRIALPEGAGAGVYDAPSRRFYIASGTSLSVISSESLKQVGAMPVGFGGMASMAIDHDANRLYVNQMGAGRVAVVSLARGAVQKEWNFPGIAFSAAMAFDAARQRLFVASSRPGKLLIVDTQTGKLVQSLDCLQNAASISFDPAHARLFVTGEEGLCIYAEQEGGGYVSESRFGTMKGKTSVYVPSLQQLFTVHGQSGEDGPGLQVYRVNR